MQEIRKSRNSEKVGIRKKRNKIRKQKIRKSQKLEKKLKQGKKNIDQLGHG